MDLREKRVILTGGVRGLGRATLERLIRAGANVTVLDVDGEGLEGLVKQHPTVTVLRCDVSRYEEVTEAVRSAAAAGVPDVLINNAGFLYSAPLVQIGPNGAVPHDRDAWERVLASNLGSVFYVSACVVPIMVAARRKGVLVNVSSVSAAGNPGQTAYSAAKAGVNALTATWARELGPWGIRVFGVAPGFIDTDSTRAAVQERTLTDIVTRVPLRRLGRPDEVAQAIVSAIENDYFNGRVLELDGGLRA